MENKIDWKSYVIELLIVTSGILIAFGLNSWNETQKEEKLANLYLEGIYEELTINKTALESTLEYHSELLQSLNEKPLDVTLVLKPASVNNSAWKLAENDIFKRYVDPKLYQKITEAYQVHESLQSHGNESSSMMAELNVLGPVYMSSTAGRTFSEEEELNFRKSVRQGWIPIFQDWIYYEKTYIEKIDNVLNHEQ